jgi:hypothetical protein
MDGTAREGEKGRSRQLKRAFPAPPVLFTDQKVARKLAIAAHFCIEVEASVTRERS